MLYEYRCYTVAPGKMPDLQKRFRDHTIRIWERYDIKPVAFFTPVVAANNNQFIFILEFKDMAHRENAWNAFMADPEWQEALARSHDNGIIVTNVENKFLAATDFSPIK